MEKVLVEIILPAANTSYDVYIPLASKMSEVLFLVSGLLSDLAGGKYKANTDVVLCEATSGSIYDINKTVDELGLHNGSRLLLI